MTSPDTDEFSLQRILIHYVQQTFIVDGNKPALEAAIGDCLHGYHVALQTLIDAFPSKSTAYIQQLTEKDILDRLQFDFDVVADILLRAGWRPQSAPKWLRRCARKLMSDDEIENPWAVFLGTLGAVHAQGIAIEHPDDPIIRFVILLRASPPKPPGIRDLDEAHITRKLLDLNISIDKAAVVAAAEANLWGCVGVLAGKLKGE